MLATTGSAVTMGNNSIDPKDSLTSRTGLVSSTQDFWTSGAQKKKRVYSPVSEKEQDRTFSSRALMLVRHLETLPFTWYP